MLASLAFVLAAYLIGSVSFAVVASRLFGLPDPHSYGSGNPGATNVLRTGNKAGGGIDAHRRRRERLARRISCASVRTRLRRRGVDGACRRARRFPRPSLSRCSTGFAGGKGVATAAGIVFALSWPLGLALGALWLVMARRIQDQLARGAYHRGARAVRRVLRIRQYADRLGDGRDLAAALLAAPREHPAAPRRQRTHDRALTRERSGARQTAGSDARSQRGRTENA